MILFAGMGVGAMGPIVCLATCAITYFELEHAEVVDGE